MPIFKLPNEGDTHTGHVTSCTTEKGKYGEQVRFVFSNDDVLYVPKVSADRQLLRAGFDGGGTPPTVNYAGVAGNTLVFSRDHNSAAPDKPYWGISIATGAAPAPSKRLAGPTQVPGDTPERYKGKPAQAAAPDWSEVPTPDAPEPQDYPVRGGHPADQHVRGAAGQPSGSTGRTREHIAAAYAWALKTSRESQFIGFSDCGIAPTPDSIQAGAATLLIQLEKTGLLFQPFDKEAVKEALDLEEIFG